VPLLGHSFSCHAGEHHAIPVVRFCGPQGHRTLPMCGPAGSWCSQTTIAVMLSLPGTACPLNRSGRRAMLLVGISAPCSASCHLSCCRGMTECWLRASIAFWSATGVGLSQQLHAAACLAPQPAA
jgi:hypothetical protein